MYCLKQKSADNIARRKLLSFAKLFSVSATITFEGRDVVSQPDTSGGQ